MSPPSPSSHPARSRVRRSRAALLWVAFGVASLATGYTVFHLHRTLQQELVEQSLQAREVEQSKALARVRTQTAGLQHATIKTLAAFHVEGLAHALQRWDETEPHIVGTFQWDDRQGFLPGTSFPKAAVDTGKLPSLWHRFREWRQLHPAAPRGELEANGPFYTSHLRTLDNPDFPAHELGYQSENLDMLAYANRPADPWAGWAGHREDPNHPWIVWYQAGPDSVIRGCLVDPASLISDLRATLADQSLARIELLPLDRTRTQAGSATINEPLSAWLPAHRLVAESGHLFVAKQASAQFYGYAVVLLLGLFLVGAAFLALFSRREARDAARKTTFVTQVSHELRTPLTSIRMFADLLATPELSAEKRTKYAGSISRESERLASLIERLLTFNALERGRQPVSIVPFDVAAIARETLDEMEAALHHAGLRLEAALPQEPAIAASDPAVVKQALLNLLDNAVKYAGSGATLRLALAAAATTVRLEISDNGPGIPSDLAERAFEPFVQGTQLLTEKSAGVGLGLSIARGLLRNAGADLVLLPSERGARFEIRLPVASP